MNDSRRRRVLSLTLIRSHLELCSQIWRPTGKTLLSKFESFQKKCLKRILLEEELSYYSHASYLRRCQARPDPEQNLRGGAKFKDYMC